MKCFYHVDNDGKCAGYWVRKFCETRLIDYNKEDFIKINYNIRFPLEIIKPNETVFIVDFSIDPEEMKKLLKITKYVIWIDHHISAIKKYDKYPELKIDGIRDTRYSGAYLTWYYHEFVRCNMETKPNLYEAYDMCPKATQLVDDYDCWKLELPFSKKFKEGIELYNNNEPYDHIWDDVMFDHANFMLDMVIHNGEIVIKNREQMSKFLLSEASKECKFEGLNILVMNTAFKGSDWFGDKINEYDAVIPFYLNDKGEWSYSIYTAKDNIDVSLIAQKYGGGGHKKAAGFFTDKCLFE